MSLLQPIETLRRVLAIKVDVQLRIQLVKLRQVKPLLRPLRDRGMRRRPCLLGLVGEEKREWMGSGFEESRHEVVVGLVRNLDIAG